MIQKKEVKILNRWFAEPDPGYYGVRIDIINLWWICSICGGPRGEIKRVNQPEDGAWYSIDVWENPCGHIDSYRDVYNEVIGRNVKNEY